MTIIHCIHYHTVPWCSTTKTRNGRVIVNPHRIHYTCYINNYSQSSILGAYWSTFYTLRIIKITGSCKILQTVLKSYKAHTHYTLYSLEIIYGRRLFPLSKRNRNISITSAMNQLGGFVCVWQKYGIF